MLSQNIGPPIATVLLLPLSYKKTCDNVKTKPKLKLQILK